jgi:PIN domain nuclease of toxin-antitoxin system
VTRFLLDTHVLLWWADAPGRLSKMARHVIASGRNQLYVSHASLWEIAIKESTGKLVLPQATDVLMKRARCHELPIGSQHITAIKELPHLHGDPFDRMLIAQAQRECLTLITHDRDILAYDVDLLAA